jgi:DMSO/TMAO reductase YedYZ molybdopterin-dependent catalytic subunit
VVKEIAAERLVPIKLAPFNAESEIGKLAAEVTPNEDFYVRSNFKLPRLDPAGYRLRVGGNVERPLELDLDALRRLGALTLVTTMECAGNNRMSLVPLPTGEPWQGGAVSTGRWGGVPLAAVLERAGPQAGTVEILFVGADRGRPRDLPGDLAEADGDVPFARSLPLEKALHPDTLLALEMNGQPLPADHGAPLRLIVPSWYGMASVKWVARIEALTEPFRGYYQANRYIYDYGEGTPGPVTTMLVKSTIVSPADGAIVPVGPSVVRGRAWSGSGDVARVEVAIDGGESWREARLGPAVGPYGWRGWELDWEATDPGRHALRCRATDTAGNVQPPIARWNRHGYGSNGVQILVVNTR